jgi:hypothetical protein
MEDWPQLTDARLISAPPFELLRSENKFLVVPAGNCNYGFAENLDVVVEGRHHYLLSEANGEPRPRLVDRR